MGETTMNPLGPLVAFQPPPMPPLDLLLDGTSVRLEPLSVAHVSDLEREFRGHDALWDYMAVGPFATPEAFRTWVEGAAGKPDPFFLAIIDKSSGRAVGLASFMRIVPKDGVIEVGSISFSPSLQATVMASEAMYLMMRWVFEAGYRRYEWKCHSMNRPSRRAAQRLGFSYEGLFRQHMIIKGRNRDTAWFSILDSEWPALDAAFRNWFAPENFDANLHQKQRLSELTAPLLKALDPG